MRKNYLLYIFFNVVHRAKQLSKRSQVEQSVRLSVQTTLAACDETDDEGEVDESSGGAALAILLASRIHERRREVSLLRDNPNFRE